MLYFILKYKYCLDWNRPIYPEKIMQGEDKRTSIVIKNIPKNVKKKDIRNMVEKYGNINFLVISKDVEKENYINAYLNMINYKSIVPIYMGLRKVNFNYQGIITNIQIIYSEAQGKAELKKIFNNEYFEQWYSRYKWDTFIKK